MGPAAPKLSEREKKGRLIAPLFQTDARARVRAARVIVIVSFLAGMLFSIPLWFGERSFPAAPAAEIFSMGNWLTSGLTVIFTLCMLAGLFSSKRLWLNASLAAMMLLLLADQIRWQPWVYMYLLMLFILQTGNDAYANQTAAAFRIALIGVYCWSGVHKLNPDFLEFGVARITNLIIPSADSDMMEILKPFGYGIGLFEIAIAVCLFIPRMRHAGIGLAIVCHITILLYLSPLGIGQNYVVYPWNIAMIGLVVILFFRNDERTLAWPLNVKAAIPMVVVILLTWCAPALNLFSRWDHYLSFSLYSDKASAFLIAVEENEVPKVDGRLKNYFVRIPGMTGGALIDVNLWCLTELNVPFYPESRVFRRIARGFCELGISDEKLVFLELKRPYRKERYDHFRCNDLE